ncbi:threonine-phosphate decarboxylase CobD [Thioclava sp. A2]|uniref:threonine-phosphate decarboxylase CobD n=1 Tax=Thioclava sp. FCG-A2 TaxID=3080562 RepID=UPI002955CBE1|nr:threonine-phosphate decarboxylase CobD [Thioclava sp. A2]MDV7269728.1 threonine-phosphate decarboxylase CobD [Thioclava sp. A2]
MTNASSPRDHGGNLDAAILRFGGAPEDWVDLSTGINAQPYPVPDIPADRWNALPRKSDMAALCQAAQVAYRTNAPVVALAGAQGAIQIVPYLRPLGEARVLTPTYNEHAGALRAAGWRVTEVSHPDALRGADVAIVVNPNNPDGASYPPDFLADLAQDVGLLVVDESFGDPTPELSLAPRLDRLPENVLLLRSFGKFYGLAGLRLGFALAHPALAARIAAMAGPWPVCGPAIEIAIAALNDQDWQTETIARLSAEAARLDALAARAGWQLVGGTVLFRTYAAPDATEAQNQLARAHIWTRIFPYSAKWIRLGLPGTSEAWARLEAALAR